MKPAVRRALTQLAPGVDRFGLVLALLVLSYLVFALSGSSTPRILEGSFAVVALWLALHASAVGPRVRLWAAAMLLAAFLAVVVITQSVADSTALLAGQRELRIRHGSDTYRLRLTASGKLILTK